MTLNHEQAAAIALRAVAFLVSDEDARAGLLRMTGITADDLRGRLEDPAFLVGVLEFLLANEPRLLTFCEKAGLPPEVPERARQTLSGETWDY